MMKPGEELALGVFLNVLASLFYMTSLYYAYADDGTMQMRSMIVALVFSLPVVYILGLRRGRRSPT